MKVSPFIIACIILLSTCRSPRSKEASIETKPALDTGAASSHAEPDVNTELTSYIARLKQGLKTANATLNDSVIFTLRAGDIFLYHWQQAWLADGRSAYIAPQLVEKIDIPYFKFNFAKWQFIKSRDYELSLAAEREGIDLNSLIQQIRDKDNKALLKFYRLKDFVDAASAEEFPDDFWALINQWNDQELMGFVRTLNASDKEGFYDLMLRSAPLAKPEQYYQLYYPVAQKLLENVEM